ncbi:MAG: restriction endonuclease subunit S [Bacteroidales bacterium]|jgi:type I restriction enzyme S subunit|nr:restriction endonuclease subunit S [Bacteroidales bacterium]
METKKGYKQTEIGIIPEDWEVKRLGEIGIITMGQSPNSDGYNNERRGLPLIQGNADIENRETIIRFYTKQITKRANEGDIILTVRAPVGNVAKAKFNCCLGRGVCAIKGNDFLFHLLVFIELNWSNLSTGSTFDSINSTELSNVKLFLPSDFLEQSAIASVLSDMDEYILSLERLIAKKKAIKQGTMQNLLTGKVRLKGFNGEWVEKKLGEILDYEQPTNYIVKNTEYVTNGIPVLTAGKTFILGYTNETDNVFSELPVIIFDDFTTATQFVNFLFKVKSSAMKILKLKDKNFNLRFIFERMQMVDFPLSDHQRYWISEYSNILFKVPSLKEQNQISSILSDMDTEIEVLQAKLNKAKLVKQGAMQELLTGKIRLVNTSLQAQNIVEIRAISVDAHIIGCYIVNKLYCSKGWGRTKLQKSIHLIDYYCQLDFGGKYIRNIAGPDNQLLMNHIDSKFKQLRHVRIEVKNDDKGRKHYNYIPTTLITEIEQVFEDYPTETQKTINDLLGKIKKMDLARAEIVSTLYAVWNNRIIKGQPINDDLLLGDFYDWSEHKSDFSQDLVLRGLNYMRQEGIIPVGWGKYIDKK